MSIDSVVAGRSARAARTLRTQLLMAGAAVGALGALALSWAFSWHISPEEQKAAAAAEAKRVAFHSPAGSCLSWTQPDAGDARTVPCTQPHLFEVTGVVDISDQYPPGVPSPDLTLWRQIAEERCGEIGEAYLGKPLDPYGKLTLGVLRPPEEEWVEGDRQLRCGLQWAGPGGGLQTLDAPAAEVDQSNVWEPGTCLALVGKTVGDPVSCAGPHSYEIVATIDLAEEFTEGYPSQDKQMAWLDLRCNEAVEEYSGGMDLAEQELILGWDVREQESWDAGSTKVNCKVGATLPDDSGLAVVHGSIRKQPESAESSAPESESSDPSTDAATSAERSGSGG
ncbi:Septum formation [Amycolatopsis arida]|uniref:Septum formation n=1 Tax=Amycolatopsis arida TaxID=587909 RepID=A0A1I5YM51_9PSEU|nr:septum formation family protein [Amycolatopsis arida]SFQ44977.1 Septum formation [Amycolatopsis arida]